MLMPLKRQEVRPSPPIPTHPSRLIPSNDATILYKLRHQGIKIYVSYMYYYMEGQHAVVSELY